MQSARRFTLMLAICALSACNTLSQRDKQDQNQQVTANPPALVSPNPSLNTEKENTEKSQTVAKIEQTIVYNDVWKRIGEQLVFERHTSRTKVKNKLRWFSSHQDYIDRVADRARPYLHYIVEQLEQRQMPLDLALLPIVESAYNPFAYSPSHASGIWQFIPGTGKHYGLKQNWWYDGRRDIIASTTAALDYLEKLHKEFNGDWLLALAAYNSGERNVARAIARNRRAGKNTDFWSLRLPRETRNYVPSLLAIAELLANPDLHKIRFPLIANEVYLAQIDTEEQLDLATVATLSELSIEEVYLLNPGFNRWATDPLGPHRIVLPVDKKALFENRLATLADSDKISWKRHIIQKGETLGQLAERYHISLAGLKQANSLHSNLIRTGHSLLIPSSQEPLQHYTLSMDARRYRGLKRSGRGEKYIYRVQSGDTLWDIGRQYGFSVKQLCSWNGISSRSLLRPGQKLNLWFSSAKQGKLIKAKLSKPAQSQYIVKKGDSLWLIARRFGVTVKQLQAWNKLSNRKYLRPGQKLLLFPGDAAKGA